MQEEREGLQKELEDMKHSVAEMQAEQAEKDKALKEAREKCTSLESQCSQANQLQSHVQEARGKARRLQKQSEESAKALRQAEERCSALEMQLRDTDTSMDEKMAKESEAEEALAANQKRCKDLEVVAQKAQVRSSDHCSREFMADSAGDQDKYTELKQSIDAKETALRNKEAELLRLEESLRKREEHAQQIIATKTQAEKDSMKAREDEVSKELQS